MITLQHVLMQALIVFIYLQLGCVHIYWVMHVPELLSFAQELWYEQT